MNKKLRRTIGALPIVTGNGPQDFLTRDEVGAKMRTFYRTLYKRMHLPIPAEYR